MKVFLNSLLLCLALSACGPLEAMDIVPIKYAPVTVISSRVVPPAPAESAGQSNLQQIPEINGCWEYIPADPAQPVLRRSFVQVTAQSYSYHYAMAELSREAGTPAKQTEKGSANYMPRQGQVSISANSRSRREGATRNDERSLELDGLAYSKIDAEPCW